MSHWLQKLRVAAAVFAALTLCGVVGHAFVAAGSTDHEQQFSAGVIASPHPGVFHASSPPVQVGDSVEPETVVGEVDGLTTTNVRSGVTGIIAEIVVREGQDVEAGQALFRVRVARPEPGQE